jgi:hypothetical protein
MKAIYALCILVIHSINNPFLETVVTSETQEPSNWMLWRDTEWESDLKSCALLPILCTLFYHKLLAWLVLQQVALSMTNSTKHCISLKVEKSRFRSMNIYRTQKYSWVFGVCHVHFTSPQLITIWSYFHVSVTVNRVWIDYLLCWMLIIIYD